jgi:hypothetical protein
MSIGQIIVLTAVVGAFALFTSVLGWGDYRAQQLARRIRDRNQKEAALAESAISMKNTGTSATVVSGTALFAQAARWPQASDDRLQHVA